MDILIEMLAEEPLLLLFLVAAVGWPLGRIPILGSRLGVAAVLFAGLAVGALDPRLRLPDIIYLLGLVLLHVQVVSSAPSGRPLQVSVREGRNLGHRSFFPKHPPDMEVKVYNPEWNEDAPVKLFIVGANEWKTAADWPVPGTRWTPFYLHKDGILSEHEFWPDDVSLLDPGVAEEVLAHYVALWDLTNRQDARNCEWQQQGMQSRAFAHGVYVPQEFDAHRFAQWVRAGLAGDEVRDQP